MIEREVADIKDASLLDPDVFLSRHSFQIIDLDLQRTQIIGEPRIVRDQVRYGFNTYPGKERLVVDIRIPFVPNSNVQKILSLTSSRAIAGPIPPLSRLSVPESHFTLTEVEITDAQKPNDEIDKAIREFSQDIDRFNFDIERDNKDLKVRIEGLCERRREELQQSSRATQTALENIKLPIITHCQKIPVSVQTKKKVSEVRKQSKTATKPHPFLEQRHVDAFIDTLFRLGKQFEVAPRAYKKLAEEDLRHILLATLNTVFEMDGKGEAFNRIGKTDLYFSLAVDRGCVFIGECKIWKGKKSITNALEQLFGYLDWRKNFASLIVLTKDTGISTVLSEASSEIRGHSTFISLDTRRQSEGFLVSSHRHPRDSKREITLHSLFFDLSSS